MVINILQTDIVDELEVGNLGRIKDYVVLRASMEA